MLPGSVVVWAGQGRRLSGVAMNSPGVFADLAAQRACWHPVAFAGEVASGGAAERPAQRRGPSVQPRSCATGTLNVLNAARLGGVRRVVYAASSSAYGDTPGSVRTEDDPVSPLSPYAAAKLAGEHYCRCFTSVYGLETVRLRFFNIFGPRQDAQPLSGVIALFIGAMASGMRSHHPRGWPAIARLHLRG